MELVESFAQNYRWSMKEILDMTMPQIYMLSGAAQTNRDRLDKKTPRSSPKPPATPRVDLWHGKPIDQLNSAEYLAYFNAIQAEAQS